MPLGFHELCLFSFSRDKVGVKNTTCRGGDFLRHLADPDLGPALKTENTFAPENSNATSAQ